MTNQEDNDEAPTTSKLPHPPLTGRREPNEDPPLSELTDWASSEEGRQIRQESLALEEDDPAEAIFMAVAAAFKAGWTRRWRFEQRAPGERSDEVTERSGNAEDRPLAGSSEP